MAPGALVSDVPSPTPITHRSGHALEATSDAIDAVNVLKSTLQSQSHQDGLSSSQKDKSTFRKYESATAAVKSFYLEQHTKQTVAYNLRARSLFHNTTRAHMTIWQAMEKLNTLIDESDPDTSLTQIEHLLQTAEAIRRDGKPRWMQLVGLVHDLGKLLYFFGADGQWDVVGDTFPVGCAFDKESNIYPETFSGNPDAQDPIYSTENGIYVPGCGLDNVMMSWGHDEYLYLVLKDQSTIPEEGLAMIRYHSFYPWHKQGGYRWMMGESDDRLLEAVKEFNPYDLYSKGDGAPDVEALRGYYEGVIDEFIGMERVIRW